MKELKIDLKNEKGETNHYVETFVPSMKVLELMELNVKISKNELDYAQSLQSKVDFVASVFSDPRVTSDAILDGLPSWELNPKIDELADQIMGLEELETKKGK